MLSVITAGLAYNAANGRPVFGCSRASLRMSEPSTPFATCVFLRHGQSVWNEANLFTGWADVGLTTLGKNEAAQVRTLTLTLTLARQDP